MVFISYKVEDYNEASFESDIVPHKFSILKDRIFQHFRQGGPVPDGLCHVGRWKFSIGDAEITDDLYRFYMPMLMNDSNHLIKIDAKGDAFEVVHVPNEPARRGHIRRKRYLEVAGRERRRVDAETPYNGDVLFNEYFSEEQKASRPLESHPKDYEPIKLNVARENSEYHARLRALLYKAMMFDSDSLLYKFANVRILGRIKERSRGRYHNICHGLCQCGKCKCLCVAAILSHWRGFTPIILVMNIGGDNHMVRINEECDGFGKLCREYLRDIHDIDEQDLQWCTLNVASGAGIESWVKDGRRTNKKPDIICERYNHSTIPKIMKNFANGENIQGKFAILADEADQAKLSVNGELGAAEKATHQREYATGEAQDTDTLKNLAAEWTSFTRTISPLITEDHEVIRIIRITPPDNYVSFRKPEDNNPENPRFRHYVHLVPTQNSVTLKRKDYLGDDGAYAAARDPGIKEMLQHAKNLYDRNALPYVSALICTSADRSNNGIKSDHARYLILHAQEFHLPVSAITFTLCGKQFDSQTDEAVFYVDSRELKDDTLTQVRTDFERFHEKEELQLEPAVADRDIGVTKLTFKLVRSKQKRLTIFNCYDIAHFLNKAIGRTDKPFLVAITGAFANRGNPFKNSNHQFPLTHGYMDVKTRAVCNLEGEEQEKNRMSSVDDCDFDRYLFVPEEHEHWIRSSFTIQDELASIFPENNEFTTLELLQRLKITNPEHKIFEIMRPKETGIRHRRPRDPSPDLRVTKPKLSREYVTKFTQANVVPNLATNENVIPNEDNQRPSEVYRNAFSQMLQSAANAINPYMSVTQMCEVWKRLPNTIGNNTQLDGHWLAICYLLCRTGSVVQSSSWDLDERTFYNYFDVQKVNVVRALTTYRANTGRSWRHNAAFGIHLVDIGNDQYSLAW